IQPGCVFSGESKRILGNIDPGNFCLGKFRRQSERDYSAASSNVQNFGFRISDFGFQELNKFLRFRSRNECAAVTEKCVSAKFDSAEQMLKRLAFATPPHEVAQRHQLRLCEFALEFEIKVEPFPSQHVSKQMFRIQTRIVDLAFFEIRSRRLQYVEHGHAPLVCHVECSR